MTFQVINVGTVANDGTGDPLRTAFIKVNSNFAETANLNSPHFTGDPQAPTPLPGDNDTSIATTAFVTNALVAYAPLASPLFTGDPRVPTPPNADNDTSIPNTSWVKANFAHVDPSNPPPAGVDLAAYAPLASPLFTGDPRAPTPLTSDNDTSIATTAYVQNAILGISGGGDPNAIPPTLAKFLGTPPAGRLTLQSHEPVMSSSVTGATTIFYTPYTGRTIPLYDGTNFLVTRFDELSAVVSDAVHSPSNGITAGKVYDWFVWNDISVPATPVLRLTHGPEWADVGTRSAGTGLVRVDGIWINSAAITNGPGAQRGTYVGTTYCQVTNKLTWVHGATGARARYHVWNAFNRVNIGSTVIDSAESWTANAGTIWEMLNTNANNRAEAVCGLQEESFDLTMLVMSQTQPGDNTYIAIGLDWTSGAPDADAVYVSVGAGNTSLQAHHVTTPSIGFHFWQVLQASDTGESTFYGSFAPLWASGLTFNGRM